MEVILVLVALVLLMVLVSWDKDRMEIQAKQAADTRPRGTAVTPRAVITVPSLFIAAAALATIAVALAVQPPAPPFTGRGSWVLALLHDFLGSYAPAMVVLALALVCVFGAIMCIKQREA